MRRYGVRSLGLFGSAARGAAREGSDLDFVVEFDSKTFDAYMDLKAFLERLLGRRVDLVLRDAIKPRLRESVLSEALHAPGLQGLPRRHPGLPSPPPLGIRCESVSTSPHLTASRPVARVSAWTRS